MFDYFSSSMFNYLVANFSITQNNESKSWLSTFKIFFDIKADDLLQIYGLKDVFFILLMTLIKTTDFLTESNKKQLE